LTTQASEDSEKPRSSRIEGRATFTIVESRTIISDPLHRTKRASQRPRWSSSVIVVSGSGSVRERCCICEK